MGNAMFYCMLQPVFTVRVIRSDGEVLEFDRPVITKHLIEVYPGHLVVHCSQVSRTTGHGQRSKVSMMEPDDTLSPGETYCLLRVPTLGGRAFVPKAPTSKSGQGKRGSKHSKFLRLQDMIFGTASDVRVCDTDVAKQLQQHYVIQYTPRPPAIQQHQQPSGPWRPHLDAIIESPLNPSVPSRAHRISMSHLTRQCKPDTLQGQLQQLLERRSKPLRASTH